MQGLSKAGRKIYSRRWSQNNELKTSRVCVCAQVVPVFCIIITATNCQRRRIKIEETHRTGELA